MRARVAHRLPLGICLALVIVFAFALPAQAKLLDRLDPTFGKNGVAASKQLPRKAYSWEIAQNVGRVVTSFSYETPYSRKRPIRSTLYFAEFTPAGERITTFGNGGVLTYKPGAWVPTYSMTIDPQGRVLLILGSSRTANFYEQTLEVVRLRADGVIDESFNAGRPLALESGDIFDDAEAKVTPSGKILVFNSAPNNDPTLYSVTDAGALDPTFGTGGKLPMPADIPSDNPDAVFDESGKQWTFEALADDGSAYMSTERSLGHVGPGIDDYGYRPLIYKFTPGGQLDAAFGVGGLLSLVRPEREAYVDSVGLRADGGLTALLFLRKKKGKGSSTSAISMRLYGSTVTGIQPFPLSKVRSYSIVEEFNIGADGAIAHLASGDRQFELTLTGPDGANARRYKKLVLPRSMDEYYAALIDSSQTRSVLIGGGEGRRMTVVRYRPGG